MSGIPTTSIPDSWSWSRIQDVATTATGGTPSRTVSKYFGGTIPWVKSGELGDSHVFETAETLSELGLKSSNAKLFPKGTLCIALYGATVGKLGILEVEAATNQAVCGIFLPSDIHRDYVFHYLASIRRNLIEQGKGGAQSNISNGLVRETWIPIAPFPEQRRIVAKVEELFSDLDAGVAALARAKANLKRYRAAVLKAAVEGKLTEVWRAEHPAAEPASKLLARILTERRQKWEAKQLAKFAAAKKEPPKNWREKYVEPTPPDATELPDLPNGWCWATIHQLNSAERPISYGVLQPGHDLEVGVPLVRVCDVADGKVAVEQLKKIAPEISKQFQRTILQGGEVVLTVVGTIGRTAIAPVELAGANTARAVAVIAVVSPCNAQFLELTLREPSMRAKLTRAAHEVARKTLNLEDVRVVPVPLAPLKEQQQILQIVAERQSQIDAAELFISHSLFRASRLRQSILRQAFEGKLVPQDPSDEPASVLLARLHVTRSSEGNGKSATSTQARRHGPKTKMPKELTSE